MVFWELDILPYLNGWGRTWSLESVEMAVFNYWMSNAMIQNSISSNPTG
jgi:hypothetical protein